MKDILSSDSEIGKCIASGEKVTILPEHLHMVRTGRRPEKRCGNCGYQTAENFEFCPKCGGRF